MPILLEEDLKRPLPKMITVRQQFNEEHLEDDEVKNVVRGQLKKDGIRTLVKPGMRIAVAVGSRGIRNLYAIVESVIETLKEMGAAPFIVSAMGSHGNGTEEGQLEVLAAQDVAPRRRRRLHVLDLPAAPRPLLRHGEPLREHLPLPARAL